MQYFKRNWDEPRSGTGSEWGTSTWYFETESDLWPTRQIEVYADGTVLQYDRQHLGDEFGGLSEAALDAEDFSPFEITQEEFERAWSTHRPVNREQRNAV